MSGRLFHSKDKPGNGRELQLWTVQPHQPDSPAELFGECLQSPLKEKAEQYNLCHQQDFTECASFFVCWDIFVFFFPSGIKAESIYTLLPLFSEAFLVGFILLVEFSLFFFTMNKCYPAYMQGLYMG